MLTVGAGALLVACAADDGAQGSSTAPVTTASSDTTATSATSATSATTGQPVDPVTPVETGSVVFTPFVRDLTNPVDLAWRSGDSTLYVVEQDGFIVPVRDGAAEAPVLDISDTVLAGGEQGLLGLAFHPTKQMAYVNYTRGNGDTVIAEYAVGADGTFDVASAREVLVVEQPYPNHNGGDLTFGPDGYMYIGTGDGGAADDPDRNGLDLSTLLAKMLRIAPSAAGNKPYTVPTDNPFVDVAGARPEIWSIGLRNPWRFNFDSSTGDLWIGDVGQGEWEEVDLARAADGGGRGVNFGWSAWEGSHRFNDDQSAGDATMPIFEYPHGDGGCSVSGGTVYRGQAIASLVGWYVFGDYCSGTVTALHAVDGILVGQVELGQIPSVSAICNGPDGELYALSLDGVLYRLDPA